MDLFFNGLTGMKVWLSSEVVQCTASLCKIVQVSAVVGLPLLIWLYIVNMWFVIFSAITVEFVFDFVQKPFHKKSFNV